MKDVRNKKFVKSTFMKGIFVGLLVGLICCGLYKLDGEEFNIIYRLNALFNGLTEEPVLNNGGFETNVISSNYEYINTTGWSSGTHDNKILTSKFGAITTDYFVEINSDMPNSYYRDITLEQNKDYKFDISHRAHVRSNTTNQFTFDELAVILGPKQSISPAQNSDKKDQFMLMSSWLKDNIKSIAVNNISNKYTVYSSPFGESGTFTTEGFSFTKTDVYTEKWFIWIIKSSTYNFFEYTIDFNSEELENGMVALSSVSSGYAGNGSISYGNIVKYFKIYNNDATLLDFDLDKIYNDNQTIFSTLPTKGYGVFDALNGTNPPITDNWWNVTETSKKIEFGYRSSVKNAYYLNEISRIQATEGSQFVVADNIYQNIDIGTNKHLEISFVSRSLNPLASLPNRIFVFNTSLVPTINFETKKTQLDLLSEYMNSLGTVSDEQNIIFTADFDSNGLFTVDVNDAFSTTKDEIHKNPISYIDYAPNVSDEWRKYALFIDLTDSGIEGNVSIYFNSSAYGGESNLLDNVAVSFSTEIDFLSSEFEGNGTESNPFLIKNEEDFVKFRNYAYNSKSDFLDIYFKQTNDITFTSNLSISEIPSFAGTYDGAGYSLKNINMASTTGNSRVSLFYELIGTIKNLGIQNSTFIGWSISGIADKMSGNSVIENCFVQATLSSSNTDASYAAGLVSAINGNAKILNSYFYGVQNAVTNFGIGAYRANSTPTFINVFSNFSPNISAYSATGAVPTITNSSTKSLTEMQDTEFLNTLNEYASTNNSLVAWVVDEETGLPVLLPDVINPELKKLYVKNNVEGNDLYLFSRDGKYYLYLSKNINRENMITNFVVNSPQIEVFVYDKDGNELGKIENGVANDYFVNDEVVIKLKYKNEFSGNYVINVMQSDLPSVYLNINPTETETADQLLTKINSDRNHDIGFPGIAYIRNSNDELTTATFKKMKGRGNATWTYSKRPYQVKFNEDISMLGMKPSKTWLFITNYTDGSLTRSAVFYKLAQELGIDYAIEFETADVYINGKYNGTYLVTSKVERGTNRVDISKNDSLIEIDNYVDTNQFTSNISNHKFTIKYPDLDEVTEEERNEKIELNKTLIDDLESKIYNENVTYEELSQIIDLESFAKAYWVFEISENYDAMYGSSYIYTKNKLVHMGPMWDFDNTLNMLSQNNTSLTDYYLLGNRGGAGDRRVRWFNQLMKRQEFSDLVDKVFLDNIEIFKELANSAKNYNLKINKSALMNYSRWPYDVMKSEHSYYMGGNSFEEASTNLISSIETRVNFYLEEYKNLIMKQVKYETTDVNGNTITNTIDLTDNKTIKLPNTIKDDVEISLIGITDDSNEVDTPSITLSNGTFNNKIYFTNNVSVNCDKKTNRSYYNLLFEKETPVIKKLEIEEVPTKTEYYQGDTFDKSGMVVNAIYTDNTKKEITDYVIDKSVLTLNDREIEISYDSKVATLPITVKPNPVISIEIKQLPNKTTYIDGEDIKLDGLEVVSVYESGKKELIDGYTINSNKATLSTNKIVISYLEYTCKFDITVEENSIIDLQITKKPNKLEYLVGEKFNTEGMIITAEYKDGTKKQITDYEIDKSVLTINDKEVKIKYDSKVISLPITVKIDSVKSIEIKQLPNKTTYIDGEDIKTDGLEVVAVYESGKKELIEDYTMSNNKATLSTNKIVISYLAYTCKFDITVEENSIIDLQITKKPNKLEYLVGEKFNTEGMIVTAEYKDGTKKEITDYKYPTNKLTINNKLIYIEYKGNKVPLNLTIINKQVVNNNGAQKPNKNPIQDIEEDYTFVYGANQYIIIGSGNTLRFEINSSIDLLDKIYINNKLLDVNNYSISESEKNLSISINNSYLESLKPDEYSIEIKLNNGKELSTKFLISNKNSDETENIIDKEDVVDKTNKFNIKWLYSLFIVPIVMVIIFLKRKLEN